METTRPHPTKAVRRVCWLAVGVVSCGLAGVAAQAFWTATWTSKGAAPMRHWAAATFMPSTCEMVVFGGDDPDWQVRDETLVFDPVTDAWTILPRGPKGPRGRIHAGLSWDATRKIAVMFGGGWVSASQETWGFDPATRKWSALVGQCTKVPCPTARLLHAQAWSAVRQATVIFGGLASGQALGDLWQLRAVVGRRGTVTWSWSQLAPTADPAAGFPVPRRGGGMAEIVDGSYSGHLLIYGGYRDRSASPALTDTWLYDPTANRYTKINATPPTPSYGFATSWSPSLGAVVVQGGYASGGQLTRETWAFDDVNLAWARVATNGDPVGDRGYHELVSNTCDSNAILFGVPEGQATNPTWILR